MTDGHFSHSGSPYRLSYADRIRLEMEEERKEQSYADRVAETLTRELAGETFTSLESLTEAAHTRMLAVRDIGPRQLKALHTACRELWCGLTFRQRTTLDINDHGLVQSITFPRAA